MLKRQNHHSQPLMMNMEITVISAQGLKTTSPTLFSHKIRPFITLTPTLPPSTTPCTPTANGDRDCHAYKTKVDGEGGINPTWGDKFHVPIDTNFFTNRYSCIYLHLYTKGLIMGRSQLGWCQISAQDIGFSPVGSSRNLSYRLRARDGSRTSGIVNLSVKVEKLGPVTGRGQPNSVHAPSFDMCGTVIGTPVTALVPRLGACSVSCQGQFNQGAFRCKAGDAWPLCDCANEGTGTPLESKVGKT